MSGMVIVLHTVIVIKIVSEVMCASLDVVGNRVSILGNWPGNALTGKPEHNRTGFDGKRRD